MASLNCGHPCWQTIVTELDRHTHFQDESHGPFFPAVRSRLVPGSFLASINEIELVSDGLVLISWSDSVHGHFTDQVWARSKTTNAGVCLLSGEQIAIKSSVYMPRRRADSARAYSDMILSSELSSLRIGERLARMESAHRPCTSLHPFSGFAATQGYSNNGGQLPMQANLGESSC